MGNTAVLHIEKRMEVSSVLERHICRQEIRYIENIRTEMVWTPDNANPDKSHLNKEFISREAVSSDGKIQHLTIMQAVRRRIDDCEIKVRKGQNTCLEMLISGSPEVLNNLSANRVYDWARDSVQWTKDTFGEENVVSATLHMDETTPHIHVIVVPVVQGESRRSRQQKERDQQEGVIRKTYNKNPQKLRLSANDVFTPQKLYTYHTSYAEAVGEKYGLKRGIMAEPGSVKKHQTSEEYNRALEAEKLEKQQLLSSLTQDIREAEERKSKARMEAGKEEFKAVKEGAKAKILQMICKTGELQEARDTIASLENKMENMKESHQAELSEHKQLISHQKYENTYITEKIREREKEITHLEEKIAGLNRTLQQLENLCPLVNNWSHNLNEMRELEMPVENIREMFIRGHTTVDLKVGAWTAKDVDVYFRRNREGKTVITYNNMGLKKFENHVVFGMPDEKKQAQKGCGMKL